MPIPPNDVTIPIVSLNTRALLHDCLTSVMKTTDVTFDVHVVDNGSLDGTCEMVAADFPEVRLTKTGANLGFAAANNYAIRAARARYVLLLNPDTVIKPDTIAQLVSYMDANQDVGICGPKVLFADGRFQSCGYAFPTLLSELRQSKNIGRVIRRAVGAEATPEVGSEPRDVDWVDGCCLLIRRETIAEIGMLDEQYFLYAEELDWCFQARQAGWRISVVPQVEMIHHQGQSSAQMSDFSLAHLIETRLRYYRKNHGLLTAAVTSVVYMAGCLKQRKRDQHKAQVKLQATMRWWRTLLAA